MRKLISIFVLTALLVSCSTSNHVVQDGLFQKRKHTSGWFVKKNKSVEKKTANEENLAFDEVKKKVSSLGTNNSSGDKKNLPEPGYIVPNKKEQTPSVHDQAKSSVVKANSEPKNHDHKKESLVAKQSSEHQSTTGLHTLDHKNKVSEEVKSKNKSHSSSSSDVELILLILLAIIIPPLAVYLVEEASTIFIVDLILFIIGISSFWFFSLGGLASLAAIVIALLVVFGLM